MQSRTAREKELQHLPRERLVEIYLQAGAEWSQVSLRDLKAHEIIEMILEVEFPKPHDQQSVK
jgi:hypothetical protein